MYIYVLPAILFFIAISFNQRVICFPNGFTINSSLFFSYLGVIFVFILTGFKGDIDPDYKNYFYYFDLIPKLSSLNGDHLRNIESLTSNVEIGMIYLMSFLKSCSLPFQSYYIFTSSIVCFLSLKLSKRYPRNEAYILLFLFCFYFQPNFIQVRYFISVLSVLMAFSIYHRCGRFNTSSCAYLAFGMLFHTVAIFAMPLFVASHFSKVLRRYWVFVLFIPLILVTVDTTGLLNNAGVVSERYSIYVNNDNYEAGNVFSFYIRYLLVCGLSLICIFFSRFKLKELNKQQEETLLLCFFMLCFWSIAWKLGILYRVALMFEICWIFFILYSNNFSNLIIKNIISFTLILYAFYRLGIGIVELKPFYFYNFNIF